MLSLLNNEMNNEIFSFKYQLFALSIALFVFAETLPFDIRDLKEDEVKGPKTIPHFLGIKKSKWLSVVAYTLLIIICLFLDFCDGQVIVSLVGSAIYALVWIVKINPKRGDLFYSLGIEGSLCMPFILYYLLSKAEFIFFH